MRPNDFAAQLNVSLANGWGIVRSVTDLCMKQAEGKYVLVKDPNKVSDVCNCGRRVCYCPSQCLQADCALSRTPSHRWRVANALLYSLLFDYTQFPSPLSTGRKRKRKQAVLTQKSQSLDETSFSCLFACDLWDVHEYRMMTTTKMNGR